MSQLTHSLKFREVDAKRWADLERLFESRGGPKHCWCMVWRATNEERKQPRGMVRKGMLKLRVDDGATIGVLGYLDGEPVSWCSIAPRTTYLRLGGPPVAGVRPEDVWSIACFFVQRRLRGQGITHELIRAAVKHAQSNGARVIEAYPVDAESPSYRYMGYVSSFAAAGFQEVGRVGIRRHAMRLRLR